MATLLTWNMLKRGVTPFRTLGMQEAYDAYRRQLAAEGKNVNTALCDELQWEAGKMYTITPNRFPYAVESPIQHYVVWFHPRRLGGRRRPSQNDMAFVVGDMWPGVRQGIVWRINPTTEMSVSAIPHAQLFLHPDLMARKKIYV